MDFGTILLASEKVLSCLAVRGMWWVRMRTEILCIYRSEQSARNSFEVQWMNWILPTDEMQKNAASSHTLKVKLRHGPLMYGCKIINYHEDKNPILKVVIDGFDTGIAPGQFAVFYDGEYCLGSAVIMK